MVIRKTPGEQEPTQRRSKAAAYPHALQTRAELACARLERALDELANAEPSADMTGMDDLKKRLASLVGRLARGVGQSDPRCQSATLIESGDEEV